MLHSSYDYRDYRDSRDSDNLRNHQGDELCANCKNPRSYWLEDHGRGEYICNGCGLVREDRMIDHSLERRNFSDGPDNSRGYSVDPYMGSIDTVTVIGHGRGKLQQINDRLKSSSALALEKNLSVGFNRIKNLCLLLELNGAVKDEAKKLYSTFVKVHIDGKKKSIGEKNIDALVLAIIYVAGRKNRVGKNIATLVQEVSDECVVTESDVQTYFSLLNKTLPQHPMLASISKPHEFATKYCNKLKTNFFVEKLSYRILDKIRDPSVSALGGEHDYEGKKPSTLAAAAVYFASEKLRHEGKEISSQGPIALSELSVLSNVAESTITSTMEKFKNTLRLLVQQSNGPRLLQAQTKKRERDRETVDSGNSNINDMCQATKMAKVDANADGPNGKVHVLPNGRIIPAEYVGDELYELLFTAN